MENFEYIEPKTLTEVCQLLGKNEEAKIMAGGSSLIMLMKNNLVTPDHLINLKTVSGLDNITYDSKNGARIGALATHQEVIDSPVIREYYPLLAEAGLKIASVGIRNQGTIGGNICHADPAADFPPALIALNATLKIVNSEGQRTMPVEALFIDYLESSLAHDEVLAEIQIPAPLPRTGWSFMELNKTSNSVAVVSVAAVISLESDGKCRQTNLVLGSAGMTPIKVEKATGILAGRKISPELIEKVAMEAQGISKPISNVYGSAEYKREMVRVLSSRALKQAISRAEAISS